MNPDGTVSAPAAPVPDGQVAGPQTQPVPPAPAKRSFRPKDGISRRMNVDNVNATGLPQILNGLGNFTFFDKKQLTTNMFRPNTLNMFIILTLLCNSMIGHDRFLKSVQLWHPLTVFLFYSVVFYVHILRIRRAAGVNTTYEITLLQGLEQTFPFENIIIPGPLVPFFMSLSTSAAPYEWFGDILARLPDLNTIDQAHNWRLSDHADDSTDYLNYPNPLLYIDAIYRFAKGHLVCGTAQGNDAMILEGDNFGYTTPVLPNAKLAHDGTKAPSPFVFGAVIFTDRANVDDGGNVPNVPITHADSRRMFYNTPHFKLPLPESKRVNEQFYSAVSESVEYYNVELQAAAPGPPAVAALHMTLLQSRLNPFALDLPSRPLQGNNNSQMLLEQLLGLTDAYGTEEAQPMLIRRWFAQLIPDMTMFCRFIEDSRPLTAINLVGLGSTHIKWTLSPNARLYQDEPIDAANDHEVYRNRQNRITITNLAATGHTADPTLDVIAERISALSFNNVDWSLIGGNAAADQGTQREGPFWQQPDMADSVSFDFLPYAASEIGRYIRPVA